jgi:tripartite-type tricarboxylate transporter receptor subunit TctC
MKKLTAAIPEAMKSPEFIEITRRSFNSTMYLDPAQFKSVLDAENRHFEKLIRDLKLAEPA